MSLSVLQRQSWMRRIARPLVATTTKTTGTTRRTFAGHGDYPGGTPQSMKATLWEGHSKAREGWETDAYVTMGLTAVMMVLAIFFKPDISIQTWAREEAQARLDLKAKGFDKFEFGTHYNTVKVANQEGEWDSFIRKAIKPGEDDDDDDDEEEEEEEEAEEEDEEDE